MAMKLRFLAVGVALAAAIGFFASCGADDDKDADNDSTGDLSFNSDIAPIVATSCGGSDCHTSGSAFTTYVGNETNVKARATEIRSRLILGDGNSLKMPKSPDAQSAVRTISGDDKTKLLTFLDQ